MNFSKFVRTPYLQKTAELLLIIAVSIAAKRELANKTLDYGTKTKAYVPKVVARSVSY